MRLARSQVLVFADRALPLGLGLIAALVVLEISPAIAQVCGSPVPGRTVGIPGCWACWTPPTTHVDGSPIELPLAYALYVYQGTPPVIGTTPPTLTTALHDGVRGVCQGLTPGQLYNVAVTAIEGTQESALSAPFPFVPDRPQQIGGLGIR